MAKYHIVIVDDQHEVRRMLRTGIESLGPQFQVQDVPSAEEAQLLLFRQKVDLLIADVKLPGISGLELIERMRKRNPDIKIFLITGLTDHNTRRQVAEAGANAFFIKPIPVADFLDAVERALGVVETLLPPEPILQEPIEPVVSVPELLSDLRKDTNAAAVILMEDTGKFLAQAGDLPPVISDASLIPGLITTLSSATKVSQSMGLSIPDSLLSFSGESYSISLAPVNASTALLWVALQEGYPGADGLKIQETVKEIRIVLSKFVGIQEPVEEFFPPSLAEEPEETQILSMELVEDEIPEEELQSVQALFDEASKASLVLQDLDGFWETLAEESDLKTGANAGALSYEEACRLGLAPNDEPEDANDDLSA